MDDSLYDEFGNYLGPDLEDDDEDLMEEQEDEQDAYDDEDGIAQEEQQHEEEQVDENSMMQIDGKNHYYVYTRNVKFYSHIIRVLA